MSLNTNGKICFGQSSDREASICSAQMLSEWSLPGVEGPPWLMNSPDPCCRCCHEEPSWTPGKHRPPHQGSVAQTASHPSDQSHWRQSVPMTIEAMTVKSGVYNERTPNSTGLQ